VRVAVGVVPPNQEMIMIDTKEENKIRRHVEAVVDYLYDDERTHFMGEKNHIFRHVAALAIWIDPLRRSEIRAILKEGEMESAE
jgi:hypothetical protein